MNRWSHAFRASSRLAFVLMLALIGIFFFHLHHLVAGTKTAPSGPIPANAQTATFGMGCFWCAQALFEKFNGVVHVECGYAGGHTENPTYEDVCSDQTGHAEVVRITYDPAKITYQQLLDIFWDVHDPPRLTVREPIRERSIVRLFSTKPRSNRSWPKRP